MRIRYDSVRYVPTLADEREDGQFWNQPGWSGIEVGYRAIHKASLPDPAPLHDRFWAFP